MSAEIILTLLNLMLPNRDRVLQFFEWNSGGLKTGSTPLSVDAPNEIIDDAIRSYLHARAIVDPGTWFSPDRIEQNSKQFHGRLALFVRLTNFYHDVAVRSGLTGQEVEEVIRRGLSDPNQVSGGYYQASGRNFNRVKPKYQGETRTAHQIMADILAMSDRALGADLKVAVPTQRGTRTRLTCPMLFR